MDAQRAEEGSEDVALLSVEVHLEGAHVLHGAKRGLAVAGLEVVVVLGDVADEVDGPALVGTERDVGLIVEEIGAVFSFRLQRPQEIAVGLIAQAVAHGKFLVAITQKGTAAQ